MTRFFVIAAVLAIASAAKASTIGGFITGPVTDGGNDTYRLMATNYFADDVTSIQLRIEGDFVNTFPLPLTFDPSPDGVAGFPDSFFVIPGGFARSDVLAVDVEDTSTVLAGSYTVPGDTPFIPAGDTSVLAVVVVPEGTPFNKSNIVQAQAQTSVNGVPQPIGPFCIFFTCFHAPDPTVPEPSTAILVSLALVGFATRRN